MKKEDSNLNNPLHPLIPEGENKCVWMNAGIVSFKLCDINFDCENCSFDKALRAGFLEAKTEIPILNEAIKEVNFDSIMRLVDTYPPFQMGIKKNLFYHSKFTWVEPVTNRTLRLGIDPFLLQLLNHVHVIVLPLVNTRIHQGEYFCWLFGEYPPLPLVAPVSGKVNIVNSSIRLEPELLVTRGNEPIWLAEIDAINFDKEKKNMIYGDTAIQWRENQIIELKKQYLSTIHENSFKAGVTLPDGGVQVRNVIDVLGKNKYYEIILKYIRKKE